MKEETNRLQVELTPLMLAELEELRRLGGLKSKRELWDTAFTLLKWAVRKKAQGAAIGSVAESGDFVELEMPFLEHYASSVQRQQAGAIPEVGDRRSAKTVVTSLTGRANNRPASIKPAKASIGKRRQTA